MPSSGAIGDADADVDHDLVLVEMERLGDRLPAAASTARGIRRLLHAVHDDGELVAAQARDGVGLARAAAQPLGHDLEQLVADGMAERIVDALEMIEIEAEHRQASRPV